MNKKYITLASLAVTALISASPVYAQSADVTKIQTFIKSIIQILVTIAGLVSAGFFVWGGFGYITSSGNPETARFISGLVRRARKYYLGATIISQQANDFLNQDYGKAIASQSSLRILMRQDTTTIKKVAEEFHLSAYEQHYLLTCDRGEALIIADQNHVAVKIVASDKEHPLLTTDPREVYN